MSRERNKSKGRTRLEIQDFISDVTQRLMPRVIRIPRPMMGSKEELIAFRARLEDAVEQSVQEWLESNRRVPTPEPPPEPAPPPAVTSGEDEFFQQQMKTMADACTGLWRLRGRLTQPGTNSPLPGVERAYRHFESVWDVLAGAGFKIMDHTGDPFDAGMSLKVISYEPTPGAEREQVLETIKPSIFYKTHCIQTGEVIVALPEK